MSIDFKKYSTMEQNYLHQHLPGFSNKLTAEESTKKRDSKYYQEDANQWEKKQKAGHRTILMFRNDQEERERKIKQLIDFERADRETHEIERKVYLSAHRSSEELALHKRKMERLQLQADSGQDIVISPRLAADQLTLLSSTQSLISLRSHLPPSTPLSGRASLSWNKLGMASQKYIEQAITPKVIQNDEKGALSIAQRIQRDEEVKKLKMSSLEHFHEKTRATFTSQHQRNIDFEAKCGLLPKTKPVIIIQSKLNKISNSKNNIVSEQKKDDKRGSHLLPLSSLSMFEEQGSTIKNSLGASLSVSPSQLQPSTRIMINHTNKDNQIVSHHLDKISFGDEVTSSWFVSSPSSQQGKKRQGNEPTQIRNGLTARGSELLSSAEGRAASPTEEIYAMKKFVNFSQMEATVEGSIISNGTMSQSCYETDRKQQQQMDRSIGSGGFFELKNFEKLDRTAYSSILGKSRRIDALSLPKKDAEPKSLLSRSEFVGLLTAEATATASLDTPFEKVMRKNGQQLQQLETNRQSTRQTKISQITQMNENTFSFTRPSTTAGGNRTKVLKNPMDIISKSALFGATNFTSIGETATDRVDASSFNLQKVFHLKNAIQSVNQVAKNVRKENISGEEDDTQSRVGLSNFYLFQLCLACVQKETLAEMDNFERKSIQNKIARIGFSQINLKNFQSKEAFVSFKHSKSRDD